MALKWHGILSTQLDYVSVSKKQKYISGCANFTCLLIGNWTTIGRTAVREAGVSWHDMGAYKGPLEIHVTSQHHGAVEEFKGCSGYFLENDMQTLFPHKWPNWVFGPRICAIFWNTPLFLRSGQFFFAYVSDDIKLKIVLTKKFSSKLFLMVWL